MFDDYFSPNHIINSYSATDRYMLITFIVISNCTRYYRNTLMLEVICPWEICMKPIS